MARVDGNPDTDWPAKRWQPTVRVCRALGNNCNVKAAVPPPSPQKRERNSFNFGNPPGAGVEWALIVERVWFIMNSATGSIAIGTSGRTRTSETVGSHAAAGALWTVLFSALNKCLALGSQIVLARMLLPEEFGLVATTLSVASLIAVMCGSTLKNVLTQRMERFNQDAPHAFWLALALNLGGALLLAVIAPVAGILFKDSRVTPLMLVFALAVPFQALPTIYAAALARQLRFRDIALIHFGAGIVQNASSVTLAWLGFGAYSLVLPWVAMALYMAVAYRLTAGRIRVGRPEIRRWGDLQRSVSWLMAVTGLAAMQTTGASLVISLMHDPRTTGYFYWGFTVSSQLGSLWVTSRQQMLMAVLARLNSEPERQSLAVSKAIQTLTLILAPVCLLQVLLAEPVIAFVFHDRWLPSVPVVQFTSLGLVTQPLNLLAATVLMAHGKFRRLAGATLLMVVVLLVAAALGCVLGRQREIALCVMVGMVLGNLIAGWLVFREFDSGWAELCAALFPALALAIPLAGVTWAACRLSSSLGTPAMTAVTVASCAVTYFALLKRFYPEILSEAVLRVTRRHRRTATSPWQP